MVNITPLGNHFKVNTLPVPAEADAIYYTLGNGGVVNAYVTDRRGNPKPIVGYAYVHGQAIASAEWTINHNLGFRPMISCYTTGGVEFEAEVVHVSENQALARTAVPVAGQARCL